MADDEEQAPDFPAADSGGLGADRDGDRGPGGDTREDGTPETAPQRQRSRTRTITSTPGRGDGGRSNGGTGSVNGGAGDGGSGNGTSGNGGPGSATATIEVPRTARPEDLWSVQLPPPRKKRPWDPVTNQFIFLGDLALFTLRSVASVPIVLTRYRKEYVRLIGDVTFGSKALAVLASTVVVAAILSAVVGVQLALEGYQGLDVIGLGPLAGYLSAFANTRELTPLLTGFGLAAQMGCRFTSELGAMAVTDEIAALEVMSIPSLAYLVTTRIMAALTVTIPLFLLALAGSYLATEITVVAVAHQGAGTYDHYFHEFLAGKDIILATLKVVVFAIFITTIHCFYGYTTTGGPENVGRSTGRAIRASIVAIAVTDMLMTILFYGTSSGIKITG